MKAPKTTSSPPPPAPTASARPTDVARLDALKNRLGVLAAEAIVVIREIVTLGGDAGNVTALAALLTRFT
jgi:hypothetical protein